MESSKEILNNFYVLQLIFHYLDFKEHLKLIKICPEFKEAIVHGVWRWMYKNLNIQQSSTGNFVLRYNAGNNVKTEHSLTSEELHIILHHSSMYIRKLQLISVRCLENIMAFNYHHLTELLICNTILNDTHLEQVAENCINLQSLSLIYITDFTYGSQSNIHANVFGEMKALNKLEIKDAEFNAWNYFDVQQLFSFAHLETLVININLRDSNANKGNDNKNTERVYNIENLTIGELPCLHSANVCFIEDLKRFENLTKLSIAGNKYRNLRLDDNDLTQINNGCPKVCELSFTKCDFRFKEFPCMNNLKHLAFRECMTLSLGNFNEIFRKLKLKSLTVFIEYHRPTVEAEDISNYRYTSNTLEALTISTGNVSNIVETFINRQHKFENVFKVTLSGILLLRPQSLHLCFSHNFPNLQELIMDSYYISSEDILHLKHLKVLQFDHFDNMSWSYLKILFQHPTLTHITITRRNGLDFEMPNCCEGLTTKMEYLCLPEEVYESTLNFWPSFRQRNKLLKFEIFDCRTLKRRPVPM